MTDKQLRYINRLTVFVRKFMVNLDYLFRSSYMSV